MNHLIIPIILFIIFLDLVWVLGSKYYFKRHPLSPDDPFEPVIIKDRLSPGLTLISLVFWNIRRHPRQFFLALLPSLEVLLVVAWAFWAGRTILHFAPDLLPTGIDFPLAVRENYFWPNLMQCGACALWNGNFDGGFPALLDLLAAPLHPIVALPTIALGVVNGGKVTVVLALAMAGLAQLWIGHSLGLARSARLWGALMAVVAGSLTARMEIGQVTLLVSSASGVVWIAALLYLHKVRSDRGAVLLALATSLLLLSGQGYIQIVIVLAVIPAALILFCAPRPDRGEWIEKIQIAGILGILSAGVLIVPLANNLPDLSKDTNLGYTTTLPLNFQLVSLVNPHQALTQDQLEWGWGMEFQTHNYLGLGPVLLALMIPVLAPKRRAREVRFFFVSIVLVYLCSTMVTPRWLLDWIDPRIAAGIRHPGVMAGMAGPLILALAAWSMDRLELFLGSSRRIFVRFFGLFLIVALATISLMMTYVSSRRWLNLESFAVEETVTEMVQPPSQQWVQISDEHYWNILAFDRGIRLTGTFHPWHFADKPAPPPALIVTRDPYLPGTEPLSPQFPGIYIKRYPENHYAAVNIGGQAVVCPAQAAGGLIRVTCDIPVDGTLIVMEHTWSGWNASVDGAPAQLHDGQWLSVDVVKGRHSIEFRYLPWDVPLGLGISLVGLVLLGLWWKKRIW